MKSLAVPKETTLSAAQDQTTNKDDVSVRSSDPDPAGERKHQTSVRTANLSEEWYQYSTIQIEYY